MNKNAESKANKEYRNLLRERTNMIIARDKELHEKGIPSGLDGPDYYKDIDEWFDSRVNGIRKKYGATK